VPHRRRTDAAGEARIGLPALLGRAILHPMMHNWFAAYRIDRGRAGGSRGLRLTLLLSAGEVLALRVPRHPHRLVCLDGRIWATQTGCPEDHLLEAGGQRSFGGRGKVVVQAVRDATVRIECLEPVRAAAGSPLRQALQQG